MRQTPRRCSSTNKNLNCVASGPVATFVPKVQVVSTLVMGSASVPDGGAEARQQRKLERRARQLARGSTAAKAELQALPKTTASESLGQLASVHRSERRLLHVLVHAVGLRHWTSTTLDGSLPVAGAGLSCRTSYLLASVPPAWPFVWDRAIYLTGPLVDASLRRCTAQLPEEARRAWQIRAGVLGPAARARSCY